VEEFNSRRGEYKMTGQIMETVVKYFQNTHMDFKQVEIYGENQLTTQLRVKNCTLMCVTKIREKGKIFAFCAAYKLHVPANKRRKVAEYLMWANDGLVLGNFEMDMETGLVLFRTSMAVADQVPSQSQIEEAIWETLFQADRYYPGLIALLEENISPHEACKIVEETDYESLPYTP
jgi:hypothetical protein